MAYDIGAWEFQASAVTTSTVTLTASLDSLLLKTVTTTLSLDSLLFKTASSTVSLDGLLNKTINTGLIEVIDDEGNPVTDESGTAILVESGFGFNLTAVLASASAVTTATNTKTASLDGLLNYSGALKTTSLDGLLFKTVTTTLSLDASLSASATSAAYTVNFDGLLNATETTGISLDSVLRTAGEVLTVGMDSHIQGDFSTITTFVRMDVKLFKWHPRPRPHTLHWDPADELPL